MKSSKRKLISKKIIKSSQDGSTYDCTIRTEYDDGTIDTYPATLDESEFLIYTMEEELRELKRDDLLRKLDDLISAVRVQERREAEYDESF